MNCQAQTLAIPEPGEVEITAAAVRGYGRLRLAVGRAITTRGASDGGLICEERGTSARPMMWRISPAGEVLPDAPYNFVRRAFVPAPLPRSLRGVDLCTTAGGRAVGRGAAQRSA